MPHFTVISYSFKSTFNLHPQLVQPLHAHRLRGAELLGEEADAEFSMTSLNHVCSFLSNHDGWRIGIATGNGWHD